MRKMLVMFLLAFPILIFAIVFFSSTIISYYVPIAVNSLEVQVGSNIMVSSVGEETLLQFMIGPKGARNNSFKIYDDSGQILVEYDDAHNAPNFNTLPTSIVELTMPKSSQPKFNDEGLISLNIKVLNYGFTRLTIVSDDGGYEGYSDIYVSDPTLPPSTIQGVVFDYTDIHKGYLFGLTNNVKVGFTYFPKMAFDNLTELEQEQINLELMTNAGLIDFNTNSSNVIIRNKQILDNGRGELTLELKSGAKIATSGLTINKSFSFNVNSGYNIYTFEDLKSVRNYGESLFLLGNIDVNDFIVFTNGTKVYGNGFKLDHSKMPQYEEKDSEGNLKYNGRYAIEFNGNNSGLYNTHVIGPLDENKLPYGNISNVGMLAKTNNDRHLEVKDNIIENGRINLTIRGHANSDIEILEDMATTFIVDNNILNGSFLTAIEVDSNPVFAYKYHATYVEISRIKISHTAIGLVVQNTRNDGGIIVVKLIEKEGIPSLSSSSWRNLDDASGALSMRDLGYILKELKSKKYSDVYKQEGKNYYVNPLIMLRGGYINRGVVDFTSDMNLFNDIIKKERSPNFFEAAHPAVGGLNPFIIYLVDPQYFSKEG